MSLNSAIFHPKNSNSIQRFSSLPGDSSKQSISPLLQSSLNFLLPWQTDLQLPPERLDLAFFKQKQFFKQTTTITRKENINKTIINQNKTQDDGNNIKCPCIRFLYWFI